MRENTDQNNSEYGHFLRSEKVVKKLKFIINSTKTVITLLYFFVIIRLKLS